MNIQLHSLLRNQLRRGAPLLFTLLLPLPTGCAFLNRDNTPLYNAVESHLWPESSGKRIAAAPLVIPAGLVAITADAFIVHPASVIDDAAEDTRDVFWDDFDWDDKYATECMLLPWRTVITPVFFTGDFLVRAGFDVKHTADDSETLDIQRAAAARMPEVLRQARELSAQGKPEEALNLLKAANFYELADESLLTDCHALRFELQWRTGRLPAVDRYEVSERARQNPAFYRPIFEQIRTQGSPADWLALDCIQLGLEDDPAAQRALLLRLLREEPSRVREELARAWHQSQIRRPDPPTPAYAWETTAAMLELADPGVSMATLFSLLNHSPSPELMPKVLRDALEKIAAHDAEPINQALARAVLNKP